MARCSWSLTLFIEYFFRSYVPWQWAAAIGCCFPIVGVLLFLTFVREESPTFLWTKGHRQESLSALKWYRKGLQPDQILDEFHAMEKSSGSAGAKTSEKERKCCSAFAQEETLKPFVIVLALLGLVPLTGIMSVTFFAIELFEGNYRISSYSFRPFMYCDLWVSKSKKE